MSAFNKTRKQLLLASFLELMKDVGTATPGHFLAFDADRQIAQVQIGIQRIDVDGRTFEPSPIIECPVAFFGGGEYFIEHQIDPGDECLIVFSQRCIDGWVNTGGVARNPIMRFHSMSDACILPGLRSQPNSISDFQNNGIRLRNKAGNRFIWLKNDGTAQIDVDTLTLNGDLVHMGDTMQTGDSAQIGTHTATGVIADDVTANNSLMANGVEQANHDHGGVSRGDQRTDPVGG